MTQQAVITKPDLLEVKVAKTTFPGSTAGGTGAALPGAKTGSDTSWVMDPAPKAAGAFPLQSGEQGSLWPLLLS